METSNTMLTQMIQDAVLKLCTQNVTFKKSLEIDGIICVSPGEDCQEIVIKMHRTIVKPEPVTNTPIWNQTIASGNSDYFSPTQSASQNDYDDTYVSQQRPSIMPATNRKPVTKQPSPAKPASMPLPVATQSTPGGRLTSDDITVKDEPPSSPRTLKRPHDDVNEPEHSNDKQPKIEQTGDIASAQEQSANNINIKEENDEPVMIELDDDDEEEGGYEAALDGGGGSWIEDGSMNTSTDNSQQMPTGDYQYTGTKPFSTTSPMQRHIMLTVNQRNRLTQKIPKEKNHQCSLCLKRFGSNADLNRHMNIHTGEKPYKCEICGQGFAAPYGLAHHRKSKGHFTAL